MYSKLIIVLDRLCGLSSVLIGIFGFAAAAAVLIHCLEGRTNSSGSTRRIRLSIFFGIAVAPIILTLGGIELLAAEARSELRSFITENAPIEVSVDGERISDPGTLLKDLVSVSPEMTQHSSPTRRFLVKLSSTNGPLIVVLARDSAIWNAYWVYFPKYRTTANSERIGMIRTKALPDY